MNPSAPILTDATVYDATWPEIANGKIYSGSAVNPPDLVRYFDIHVHDLEADTNEYFNTSPWFQMQPSASATVVAYIDTEALGTNWWADPVGHVEIADLSTSETRQVTQVPYGYYTITMHGKYLAYIAGSSTLILCDLEEGGFIDGEGHVIPEGGLPDAGVDGGAADAGADASIDAGDGG